MNPSPLIVANTPTGKSQRINGLAWVIFSFLILFEIIFIYVSISERETGNLSPEEATLMLTISSGIIALLLLVWAAVYVHAVGKDVLGYTNKKDLEIKFWTPAAIFAAICLSIGFGIGFGLLNQPIEISGEIPGETPVETAIPKTLYEIAKEGYITSTSGATIAIVPIFGVLILLLVIIWAWALWYENVVLYKFLPGLSGILVLGIGICGLFLEPGIKLLLAGTPYPVCNTEGYTTVDTTSCCTDKRQNSQSRNTGLGILLVVCFSIVLCFMIGMTIILKGNKIMLVICIILALASGVALTVGGLIIGNIVKPIPDPPECPEPTEPPDTA